MNSDERELKLPPWARETINGLRRQLVTDNEVLRRELDRLRPQVAQLKARNEALTELLECAARGGHKSAKEIMDIIAQYCDDEYVTLDSVLGRGRHQEDSGCDLGNMPK